MLDSSKAAEEGGHRVNLKRVVVVGIVLGLVGVPVLESPVIANHAGPPTIDPILAEANMPSANMTTYSTKIVYPGHEGELDPFSYGWSKQGQHCNKFNDPPSTVNTTVWDYSANCPPPPHPEATIFVTATDGEYLCTAQYNNGSQPGTGPPGSCQVLPPQCEKDGSTVYIYTRGGTVRLVRQGNQLQIFFGESQTPDSSTCSGLNVVDHNWLGFIGSSGNDVVTIDHSGGPFENNGTPTWFMGDLGLGDDVLRHTGNSQGTIFSLAPGTGEDVTHTFGPNTMVMKSPANVNLDVSDLIGSNQFNVEGNTQNNTFSVGVPFSVSGTNFPTVTFDPQAFSAWDLDGSGGNDTVDMQVPGDATFDWDPAADATQLILSNFATNLVLTLQNQRMENFLLLLGGSLLEMNAGGGPQVFDLTRRGEKLALAGLALELQEKLDIAFLNYTTLVLHLGDGNDVFNLIGEAFVDLQNLHVVIEGELGLDSAGIGLPGSILFGMPEGPLRVLDAFLQEGFDTAVNLNAGADTEVDLEASGVEKWTASGGKGKDKISGAGGGGTGTAFTFPLTLKGGGANDKLIGGNAKDKLIGGPGDKDNCNGGKAKDTYKSCEIVK